MKTTTQTQGDSMNTNHTTDAHCTLDADDQCVGCGVSHGAPCPYCEGRGFHAEDCAELARETTDSMGFDDLVRFASDELGGDDDPIRDGECVSTIAAGLVDAFGADSFGDVVAGYSTAIELVEAALTAWATANDVAVSSQTVRVVYLAGGGWCLSDDSLDYIDERGPSWPSKAEALRAASRYGYTHWIGYHGMARIPKVYRLADGDNMTTTQPSRYFISDDAGLEGVSAISTGIVLDMVIADRGVLRGSPPSRAAWPAGVYMQAGTSDDTWRVTAGACHPRPDDWILRKDPS